jgi:hypothetical protein
MPQPTQPDDPLAPAFARFHERAPEVKALVRAILDLMDLHAASVPEGGISVAHRGYIVSIEKAEQGR